MAEFIISHGCGYSEKQQHDSFDDAVEMTGQMYMCPGCGYSEYDIIWSVENPNKDGE